MSQPRNTSVNTNRIAESFHHRTARLGDRNAERTTFVEAGQIEERRARWRCRPLTEEEMVARLIAAVSRAAADPTQWGACVSEISAGLGGAAVLLTLRPPRRGDAECIAAAGIAAPFIDTYADTYYARDPWVKRMATQAPGIRFGYELVPRWKLLQSAFYREWMVPQNLLPELSISGLILKRGMRPTSTLAALRQHGTRLLQIEDVALLRRLLPHLQRAVRLTQRTLAAPDADDDGEP
jgi:hypothetical protein